MAASRVRRESPAATGKPCLRVDDKRLVKVSKYLARHLRHDPGRLGITLDRQGWVEIEELLRACARHAFRLTRDELMEVVARNDKQRFAIEGSRIRANQGHSVPVDLGLEPVAPPAVLFHGTASRNLDSIMASGLERRKRHHVHLHPDPGVAARVGGRHGRAVVLEVAAREMASDGHEFFRSSNGVWLTDVVPPRYLSPRGAPSPATRAP
jgi:putative RNA 2'-phosphotransferase